LVRSGWIEFPWRSSRLLGTEVDDVWDGSWRHCFTTLLYLAAKPAHMGVDVEGLAYLLHHPIACDCQTRGQGLLPGIVFVPSLQWGGGAFSGDVKPPGLDIWWSVDRPGTYGLVVSC
jgi:hypothetical protein